MAMNLCAVKTFHGLANGVSATVGRSRKKRGESERNELKVIYGLGNTEKGEGRKFFEKEVALNE